MTVLCYLLVVFLSLVLIVSLANSVNTKIENRGKEVCINSGICNDTAIT